MAYNAEDIKILEGLEAVRLRPGMYIGSTGKRGLHHLASEIIDNSVDEYLAGYCNRIDVILRKDGFLTIEDNGRGIPVDKHSAGISALRVIMTTLHAGGKFDSGTGRISGGLHGVGAAVVNALSEHFIVEVYRDGNKYRDEYRLGKPIVKLKNGLLEPVSKTNKVGTKISFYPDKEIFDTINFDENVIKNRLEELSYLNKGLTLTFTNENTGEKTVYKEKDGLKAFINKVIEDKKAITETILLSDKVDGSEVDIAFAYVEDNNETSLSFCNNINTHEGGTHISGFRSALTRTINQYARELNILKEKDENFKGTDVRSGLVSIVSIKYPNPEFEGQTKTKLGNPEVRGIVDEVFSFRSKLFFDRNLKTLEKIINKAQKTVKLRKAEEKVRDKFTDSNKIKLKVNGKLASAKKRDPKKTELFIVEGDSAGGSAKQGRNRDYQAILPLKGKILNVERQALHRVLDNEEIATLISAIGTSVGSDFDINKLKYNKIIIMTDADVDGAHITTLLLTFFYRYMKDLIDAGHIYIAQPPLYKVKQGKKEKYIYNDKELAIFQKEAKSENYSLQRFKGLGEMNYDELWETTLNPKTRVLKQVEISDIVRAEKTTDVLMGKRVAPRRDFIYDKAKIANIDI